MGCNTIGKQLLVQTSEGYRYDDPATHYLLEQGDRNNVWKNEWEEKKNTEDKEIDGLKYFIERGIPSDQEVIRNKGWPLKEAAKTTLQQVQTRIAGLINTEVTAEIRELLRIQVNNDELKRLEEFDYKAYAKSSASFSGLQLEREYYLVYRRIDSRKNEHLDYVHYWALYSIPMENIKEAIQEIKAAKSIEAKERTVFEHLRKLHAETVAALKKCDLFSKEDEQRYTMLYTTLLDTYGKLNNLPKLKGDKEYEEEIEKINQDVDDYDPTNILLKKNNWLTEKFEKLQSEYLVLEREKNAISNTIALYTAMVLSQLPKQNTNTLSSPSDSLRSEITALTQKTNTLQSLIEAVSRKEDEIQIAIRQQLALFGDTLSQNEKLQNEYLALEREKNAAHTTVDLYTSLAGIAHEIEQLHADITGLSKQEDSIQIDMRQQRALLDTLTQKTNTLQSLIEALSRKEQISQTVIMVPVKKPEYSVRLPSGKEVWTSSTLVTNQEYLSFVSLPADSARRIYQRSGNWLDMPACSVSWAEAIRYCNQASRMYGYEECYTDLGNHTFRFDASKNGYRLPATDEVDGFLDALLEQEQRPSIQSSLAGGYGFWLSDTDHNTAKKRVYYHEPEFNNRRSTINSHLVEEPVEGNEKIGFMIIRNAQ
jgi:hypothetical protein